jgi:hypothetical protein
MASAIKNFHLPLPVGIYAELREIAESNGQPATKLAQQLLKEGLEQLRRADRRRQIADYARSVAGTSDDFDPAIEHAGLASLGDHDR